MLPILFKLAMKRKIYNKIKRINKNIKIDIKKNINKIKLVLHIVMFFDSIKFRLPGVKTDRVPSCFHFCFLWIKTDTRISMGEISQNHQFQIHSRSLPHTCCTTSTTQHAEDQDRWNLEKDGRTPGSTRPSLSSLSSQLFFLYKRWYVQHIPHNLPQTP